MDQQEDITHFQSAVQRAVPVQRQRRLVGSRARASRRRCRRRSSSPAARSALGTFNHENMHQWWGDNVSEAELNLTFFKEGYGDARRVLLHRAHGARPPPAAHGTPPATRRSRPASSTASTRTTTRPAAASGRRRRRTRPRQRCSRTANTYTRPGTAYLALRADPRQGQLHDAMQADPARLRRRLDHRGAARGRSSTSTCRTSPRLPARLDEFFTQWLDTAYPSGRRRQQAADHGPGPGRARLRLRAAVAHTLDPAVPDGLLGWYTDDVSLEWQVYDGGAAAITRTAASTRTSRTTGRSRCRAPPRTRSARPARTP